MLLIRGTSYLIIGIRYCVPPNFHAKLKGQAPLEETTGGASPYDCSCAASTKLRISMVTVSGPTPPGTGVMYAARFSASVNSTSPTIFPSARFIPTSITIAPALIHSPLISPALPTATIKTSALLTWSSNLPTLDVPIWQTVTVANFSNNKRDKGLPTISLWPTTTTSLPYKSIPAALSNSITAAGVQGSISEAPNKILPILTGCIPSASFSGKTDWLIFL